MFPLGQERTFHALIGISAFAQEPDIGTRPPDVSRHQRSNEMHRAMQLGRDALCWDCYRLPHCNPRAWSVFHAIKKQGNRCESDPASGEQDAG